MKALFYTVSLCLFTITIQAQNATIKGLLQGSDAEPIIYANITLYDLADTSLLKVEVSDDLGIFTFSDINPGTYKLEASYVGFQNYVKDNITLEAGQDLDLGALSMASDAVDLETATVTAQRAIVEVKPDRTVFNVQGTINSAGENAIQLLRKAPGVLVDNNDNISVLSRSGVLLYVDGKRLPLSGDDLANYLRNLPAEQIDRIDIITSPGAKYEAEGNAGIIDIRLKKDDSIGTNGSISTNISRGQFTQGNANFSGNYRNKLMNIFGNVGYNAGTNFFEMAFDSYQNGLLLVEDFRNEYENDNVNFRIGTDFFLNNQHTIGFLVDVRDNEGVNGSLDRIEISRATPNSPVDSILVANNLSNTSRDQETYNLNYRYAKDDNTFNVDLDYGRFRNRAVTDQPNLYFNPTETQVTSSNLTAFDLPQDIDIYTAKVDYETKLGGIKFGVGSKLSFVSTDNTFLQFDGNSGVNIRDDRRSNRFKYDENVYAGYVNISGKFNDKWSYSAGLRAEQTDATGNLTAFIDELNEDPVEFDYISWFPSVGLTYQLSQQNTLNLNYGRRINRPDYNVLNPFNRQLSELSFEKGNPFLQPEIVNNYEIGYTLKYRYNFKLGYSYTTDQITRLIGPSADDSRSNFITWENLAEQSVYSLNISAPVDIKKWWNMYFNVNGSYIDNQADYGDGAIVDVQVWNYNLYQQSTFTLGKGWKAELSGWFAGPGVWGGVFEYDTQWSLNAGLQKKFLNEKLNARLSIQDIFFQSGWSGTSVFNGLVSTGAGQWDARRVALSLSYSFGNQKVKSRNRKTGIEDESSRVGSGN